MSSCSRVAGVRACLPIYIAKFLFKHAHADQSDPDPDPVFADCILQSSALLLPPTTLLAVLPDMHTLTHSHTCIGTLLTAFCCLYCICIFPNIRIYKYTRVCTFARSCKKYSAFKRTKHAQTQTFAYFPFAIFNCTAT